MDASHYLGVYWWARRESAEDCAKRAAFFFQSLSACDQELTRWYGKGQTLQEALEKKLETHAPAIQRVFQLQEDKEGRMQGEGFSLRLWGGEPQGGTKLSMRCGEATSWVTNSCVLTPPEEGPTAERLLRADSLSRILRAMVLAWAPEWGVATSHAYRDLMPESAEAGTFVGWLTYFSRARGPLPPLPSAVQVEPVGELGSLVILTPERFSLSRPPHLELAREVSARLAHAGLLIPLRPESG